MLAALGACVIFGVVVGALDRIVVQANTPERPDTALDSGFAAFERAQPPNDYFAILIEDGPLIFQPFDRFVTRGINRRQLYDRFHTASL